MSPSRNSTKDLGVQSQAKAWVISWVAGRTLEESFLAGCQIIERRDKISFLKSKDVVIHWTTKYNLLPMYRISEVVCEGDTSLEPDKILREVSEIANSGIYLLNAIYVSLQSNFIIFQSHEDYLALGRIYNSVAVLPAPPPPAAAAPAQGPIKEEKPEEGHG